jgi:cytochrome c oxidase subunit 4
MSEPGPIAPVTGIRTYVAVWAALVTLLALSMATTLVDLGAWNRVLNVGIAVAKALLVLAFFMHLRHASRRVRGFAVLGFAFLAILYLLTLTDYLTRG